MQKTFRSLEEALADLLAAHERAPDPKRARMVEIIRAEIQHRENGPDEPIGRFGLSNGSHR
jgi:hypothetical protein